MVVGVLPAVDSREIIAGGVIRVVTHKTARCPQIHGRLFDAISMYRTHPRIHPFPAGRTRPIDPAGQLGNKVVRRSRRRPVGTGRVAGGRPARRRISGVAAPSSWTNKILGLDRGVRPTDSPSWRNLTLDGPTKYLKQLRSMLS